VRNLSYEGFVAERPFNFVISLFKINFKNDTVPLLGMKLMDSFVGESYKGPLKNRGKPIFFRKKQNTNKLTNIKRAQNDHGSVLEAHSPGGPSGPQEQSAPATLRQNSASLEGHSAALMRLHHTRGPIAPSGEVPPRSRVGRPLG
jgi:hypothetical protein